MTARKPHPRKHGPDERMSYDEVVQYVMHAQNCSEAEAIQAIADKVDSGELGFFVEDSDGHSVKLRMLDGNPVVEQ